MNEIKHVMKNKEKLFFYICLTAVILLLLALFNLPYGYYTFLRIIIFSIACYTIIVLYRLEKTIMSLIFVIIAVLFNPIIPVYLERDIWAIIDIITAIVFLISFFTNHLSIRKNRKKENKNVY